ncbi:MAG: Flp pilus assembly complex ATPase component TadA [Lachnospiraceae bacterium]|nr:Flp pilus assembly complex ATPase component TadA [Lachnospiraceae bacterium]
MNNEILKNLIILLLLALAFILTVYFRLKFKDTSPATGEEDPFAIDTLVLAVKRHFNELIGTSIVVTDKASREKEAERLSLRKAVRNCSNGSYRAKEEVRAGIKEWLMKERLSGREDLDRIIPFDTPEALSPSVKFEILLYDYKRDYRFKAAARLLEDLLDIHRKKSLLPVQKPGVEEGNLRVVDSEDVEELYGTRRPYLDRNAKADIVTHLIYCRYKGHGVADSLRDQEIDGISAGVSGIVSEENEERPEVFDEWSDIPRAKNEGLKDYESVWVFLHGYMIRLSFLSFGSRAELERVCKNIYRYNNPGQLSATKGFIANDMQDGSRVIVVRPPFSEGWAFFVRKFGKKGTMPVNRLVRGPGSRGVQNLLKHIVSGCQVFGITGEQGCGKTTLLKALIEYIPESYTLRIQELLFELHLRDEYPARNIITFRETADISGREALDLQKKTDGTVNIIGEVASAPVAGWLVMVSQVASRFTIFTHHAKTTENLITALRNDLMTDSGFNNESVAESQVRQAVRFDVHMVRLPDGERKITRITEIARSATDPNREIVRLTDGGFEFVNDISDETAEEMKQSMSRSERDAFERDRLLYRTGGLIEEGYSA